MNINHKKLSLLENRPIYKFPLIITDLAIKKAIENRNSDDSLTPAHGLRITCKPGGCAGFKHVLDFDDEETSEDTTRTFGHKDDSIRVIVDSFSAMYLDGVRLDYKIDNWEEGFKFIGGNKLKKACGCGKSVRYV